MTEIILGLQLVTLGVAVFVAHRSRLLEKLLVMAITQPPAKPEIHPEPGRPIAPRVSAPPDTGRWQVLDKYVPEKPANSESGENGDGAGESPIRYHLQAWVREDSPAWRRAHANSSLVLRNEATGKILEAVQ